MTTTEAIVVIAIAAAVFTLMGMGMYFEHKQKMAKIHSGQDEDD